MGDFCIATTTVDGTTLEAEGVVESSLANGVKDLSLSRLKATKLIKSDAPVLGKRDLDFEVFQNLTTSESKLKLSTVLGSGVKAIGLQLQRFHQQDVVRGRVRHDPHRGAHADRHREP